MIEYNETLRKRRFSSFQHLALEWVKRCSQFQLRKSINHFPTFQTVAPFRQFIQWTLNSTVGESIYLSVHTSLCLSQQLCCEHIFSSSIGSIGCRFQNYNITHISFKWHNSNNNNLTRASQQFFASVIVDE